MTRGRQRAIGLAASLCLGLRLLAQPVTDTDVAALFAEGREAMRAGRHAAAEASYRAALERAPGLSEARANLGLVLFLQGEYESSVAEFRRVAAEKPDIPSARLFLGLGHLKLGSPGKAIPHLERSLEQAPGSLEARRALAACYLAQADFAGAIREYQAAFARHPDKVDAWFLLGRDYTTLMSELAGRLVVGQPDSPWASRLGADMLGLSQAWDAAATYYDAALASDPRQHGLHASAGVARLRLGDVEAAERHFRSELGVVPGSQEARLGLADTALARGQVESALARVAEIWASDPKRLGRVTDFPRGRMPPGTAAELAGRLPPAEGGPASFLRAALLAVSGDLGRAEQQRSLLLAAIDSAPTPEGGPAGADELCKAGLYEQCSRILESRRSLTRGELLLLGRAYLESGREQRAAIAFTHAMRGVSEPMPEALYWTVRTLQSMADQCFLQVEALDPGSWRVHQMRAEAHRQRQSDEDAAEEYRRAIELKPDEPELHRSLALLHLLNNAYDEAGESIERALALDAANPRTLYVAGRLHVARQQHGESIRFLEMAVKLDPNLVEARPSLGRAYLRAGRFEEAAAQLEQGLALDYHGDIHYSLFQAHRRLGNLDAAKAALDRSMAMRKSAFARDRGKFDRWIKSE